MLYDLHMDDNNILWIFPSDTGKELETTLEEFTKSFLKTATGTEPLHILMDSRDAGKPTASARKTFAKLGRDPRIGKCAVVGGIGRYSRVMAGFINRAVGRNNIRFFQSEKKAIAWLKE